jgi:hypothetical protein
MAHDHAALGGNGPDHKKFGLVKITLSYHYQDKQWEVDLDPTEIDIMIFGWHNYEKYKPWLPGGAGGNLMKNLNHLSPDGTVHLKPKEKWPKESKLIRGPVEVGEPFGNSVDDFCWHNDQCLWWCVSDTHMMPSP